MVRTVSNHSMNGQDNGKIENEINEMYCHILEIYEEVKNTNQVNCLNDSSSEMTHL